MRHPLASAAVLTAALCVGGCVPVPAAGPPPSAPSPVAAATRTPSPSPYPRRSLTAAPSPVPTASQPPARTALVTTASTREPRDGDRDVVVRKERRSAENPGPERRPRPRPPQPPRTPAAAPPAPVRPRARPTTLAAPRPRTAPRPPRTAQPQTGHDDLATLCALSHHSPVSPSVRELCDTYFR
ncbi:hypothetical protein [Streptomyces sp. NPDC003401]